MRRIEFPPPFCQLGLDWCKVGIFIIFVRLSSCECFRLYLRNSVKSINYTRYLPCLKSATGGNFTAFRYSFTASRAALPFLLPTRFVTTSWDSKIDPFSVTSIVFLLNKLRSTDVSPMPLWTVLHKLFSSIDDQIVHTNKTLSWGII